MAPIETRATILSTIAYGETSRVAKLATREMGVISVMAKGARRPKSRFGAALQTLSEGAATILPSRHSDLHTLTAFDVARLPTGLGESMERYGVASVLGELMLRFAPQEARPATYDFFRHALDVLEAVPTDAVAVIGLRSIWGLVKELGFAPTLTACARDGTVVNPEAGTVAFSPAHGGVLCADCARAEETSRLGATDLAHLDALIHGRDDLPSLDDRYLAAHRRLLDRYVRYHVAEGHDLPAFAFWAGQAWRPRP